MPEKQKVNRKLSAILSADVKGYSLLMADDEVHTIETLTSYRQIISDQIQDYSGRVVDSPGDNILAEFRSVVDALQCAVEIQKRLKAENDRFAEDKKVQFRMGVNIGDVIQEGDRIYGHGVNVAARIEGLSEPDGVCISRSAYDQVKDKLNLGYEYLGQHEVKNIKDPVRVYKVLIDPADAGKLIGEEQTRIRKKWVLPVVIVAAIIVTSFAWYFFQSIVKPDFERASAEKMAFPLPEKPSIAVLPFDNLSGNPEQDYIADGFTENIITGLSQIPELFVIARNSVFTYKGKPVNVKQVSEELGVKYVLEGSIQKSGDRLRVNAQLIDALKGHHLWAERYDRGLKDLFRIQDEITIKIMNALHIKLVFGGDDLWYRTENFQAWSHLIKGTKYFDRLTKDDNRKAREHFEQAIKLDPDRDGAWSGVAWTHLADVWLRLSDSPEESIEQAIQIAEKTSKGWSKGEIHDFMSRIYYMQRNYDKAIAEAKRAVELVPNSSRYLIGLADVLNHASKPEQAIVYAKKAMRLEPYYPAWFGDVLAVSYSQAGRYEEELKVNKQLFERALKGEYSIAKAHRRLAGSYAELDRIKEARAHAAEFLKIDPNFSVKEWSKKARLFFKNQNWIDRYAEVLIKAGFPEHPPLPLPDKPSIAVLAFDNLSGDPEQEYFSDGISENIITALSKVGDIFVVARHSSFTYKGKQVKVNQIGRELGVGYVLEGSVQKSGDRIRITAQLIDANNGHHLWAENYDRDLKDIFEIQDEITLKIITALHVNLTDGEQGRLWSKEEQDLDVYLKSAKAGALFNEGSRESMIRFGQLAQEIVDMAPDLSIGYRLLGWYHYRLAGFGKSPRESIQKAYDMAHKALSLNESEAFNYALLGSIYSKKKQFDSAIESGMRAVELAPNGALVHNILGLTLKNACRFDEAIVHLKQAIRLDPFPAYYFYDGLGSCYLNKGQYEKALSEYKKALQVAPNYRFVHLQLAITYALLNREKEARASAAKTMELMPYISVGGVEKTWWYACDDNLQLVLNAMRKAGFPE